MAAAAAAAPVARAAANRLLHPYCAVTRAANACSSQRIGFRSSSHSHSATAGTAGYNGNKNACGCTCGRGVTGSAVVCGTAPAHVPRAPAEFSARAAVAPSAGGALSSLWSRSCPPRRWRSAPAAMGGAQSADSADGAAAVGTGAEAGTPRNPSPFPLPSTFPVPLTLPLTLQQPPSSSSSSSSDNVNDDAQVEELTSEEVIGALQPLIEAQRWQRMAQAVRARTFAVVPVVEGLADLGNVSAVCRTADGLGFQNVHVITTRSYGDADGSAAAAGPAGAAGAAAAGAAGAAAGGAAGAAAGGAAGAAGRGITDVWSGGGTYGKEYLSWEFESDSDGESSDGAAVVVSGKKKKKKGRRKGGPMNMYRQSARVSMGADKWLHVETWDTTGECLQELKKRGYRIAVTSLSDRTVPIYDVDWTIPTAIVFGNEHSGVSEEVERAADVVVGIPMVGMVESFNISVAAALTLHHAARMRLASLGYHGDLTPEQQRILLAHFALRHRGFRSRSVVEHLVHTRAKAAAQHAAALAAAAAAATSHSTDAAAAAAAAVSDDAAAAAAAAAGRSGGEFRLGSARLGASAQRVERPVGEERRAGAAATEAGSDAFAAAAAAAGGGFGPSGIRYAAEVPPIGC